MHGETCTDKVNVSEQESYKIGMRTCSKIRNIGLLITSLILIVT